MPDGHPTFLSLYQMNATYAVLAGNMRRGRATATAAIAAVGDARLDPQRLAKIVHAVDPDETRSTGGHNHG